MERLEAQQMAMLDKGIVLFNAGRHWHAHEAWEGLWLELEGEDKRFVQGLIMAAAMLVQYGKGVRRGVLNHHANTTARLAPHAPVRWGIDVADLLAQLAPYAEAVAAPGPPGLDPAAVRIRRKTL